MVVDLGCERSPSEVTGVGQSSVVSRWSFPFTLIAGVSGIDLVAFANKRWCVAVVDHPLIEA